MKKLLLTLGTAASIAAPLATVVACGDEETPTTPGIDGDNGTENTNWLQVGGTDFLPAEDGVYLMADYYTGTLYDGATPSTEDIIEVAPNGGTMGTDPVTQLGKGDSIVVVYDNDDTDGFSAANFTSTFGYADSSPAQSTALAAYNVSTYGNVLASNAWGDSNSVYTTFENGFSNRHIGSTYNLSGLDLATTKASWSDADYTALLETYKYDEAPDGTLTDRADYDATPADPDNENDFGGPDLYLRGGELVIPQDGTSMFSYETIADNAVKVTYLFDDAAFKQDGGAFGFITETDVAGEYTMDKKGILSLGTESWDKYEAATDWNDSSIVHIWQGKKA